MKSFWKTVLAVVVGTIIVSIISTLFFFSFLGALSAGSSGKPVIPKSGVLDINMAQFNLAEQTAEENPFASLTPATLMSGDMENVPTVGLLDAVNAVHAAAEDPGVKYIFLRPDGYASGIAHAEEFRAALKAFHDSGKAIVAYTENLATGSYYIASVADKVYSTSYPGAMTNFNGISSQLIFLKDVLDKLGINIQLIRHGKYKSAGEMYIRSSASPENLEQNQVMINSIWKTLGGAIAESRGIELATLEAMIDRLELCLPDDFVEKGLVDELLTREQLKSKLADLAVVEKYSQVSMIPFADYAAAKKKVSTAKDKIAIIYADGEIVEGSGTQNIAGKRFARIISDIREDESVKAVVLRVNSPGGSVLASDRIKAEIDLLREVKPVVASYGSYAASGGYWISNACEKIYSDAGTLTGSIGVFSIIPEGSKLLKKVGVGVTTVSSARHGDLYSMFKPLDAAEHAYMQRSVEDIYDRFTSIVAEGRGLEKDYVDEIGQGRVWTGADALGIGLVDEIGTLEDALRWTADLAGEPDLDKWNIVGYPAPEDSMTQMLQMFGTKPYDDDIFSGTPLEKTARVFRQWWSDKDKTYTFARMPYEIVLE